MPDINTVDIATKVLTEGIFTNPHNPPNANSTTNIVNSAFAGIESATNIKQATEAVPIKSTVPAKSITSANNKKTSALPEIKSHIWKRYNFESKSRYYIVILQQDIFHEWSITKVYGGNNNKLGNFQVESCKSYEHALEKIKEIKKTRESHKYVLKKE